MPKVSIREIDNTGSEVLQPLDYTVLIPAPTLYYKASKDATQATVLDSRNSKINILTKPSDITSLILSNDPTKVVGSGTSTPDFILKDLGYIIAVELLKKGLSVCFVPAYTLDNDGNVTVTVDNTFFDEFQDRGRYDLRFITLGGINSNITEFSQKALICAGERGDAVAVLGVPENGSTIKGYSVYVNKSQSVWVYRKDAADGFEPEYTNLNYEIDSTHTVPADDKDKCTPISGFPVYRKEVDGAYSYSSYAGGAVDGYELVFLSVSAFKALSAEDKAKCGDAVTSVDKPLNDSEKIDTWVNQTFGTLCKSKITRKGVSWSTTEQQTETYGRYGAIFTPTFTTKVFIKTGTEIEKKVPAWFNYLACFAKYIETYKPWFAMSGSVRGVSTYKVLPDIIFGDADINSVFQPRSGSNNNGHIASNTICEIRPYGNVVWGNRTMHPLGKPENGDETADIQLVASNFLNIRQLCCSIKKTLYRAARRFTFEPNSDALWINFKGAITPLLDEMKANQGIKGYQIVKVRTNKKALLVARIRIVPIEAVEDFDLTVELADSIEVTE